jgi:hypothetical protein
MIMMPHDCPVHHRSSQVRQTSGTVWVPETSSAQVGAIMADAAEAARFRFPWAVASSSSEFLPAGAWWSVVLLAGATFGEHPAHAVAAETG